MPTDERFEGHILFAIVLDAELLSNASYPRTGDRIASKGFSGQRIDISEFGKAEEGLTCMSLIYDS